jgi:hypothetical protein
MTKARHYRGMTLKGVQAEQPALSSPLGVEFMHLCEDEVLAVIDAAEGRKDIIQSAWRA